MSSNPRKDSSSSLRVVTSLQISPNLEALLQHDELTRRGSPTSLYHPTSGFSISLPPPPPRYPTRKPTHAETRVNLKEIRRKKSVNGISVGSGSWPDALPSWNTPAGHSSSSPASSRSATPNPYINPTPTINTSDHPIEAASSFQLTQSGVHTGSAETVLPPAHRSDPDICRAPSAIIPATRALSSHRSSPTLHRVEKLFNIGRESFSLLTGVAIPSHKLSNDDYIDHRPRRTDVLESSANQSSLPIAPPARQGQGLGNRPSMSHQMFAYGDTETAAVSNVFPLVTETQQSSPARAKSSLSARPDSGSSSPSVSSTRSSSPGSLSPSEVAVPSGMSYASSLPHLPPMSPIEMPSLQQQESDQQQSFIDFFSSSSPLYPQHDLSTLFARRPSAPVILPSSINFTPSNSHLDDLPSMVFAPPSPTSASNDRPTSPADSRPSSSLSTYSDVSAMIFAPGSPTSGPRTFPRPSPSRPPVPSYSPPEPAPPSPACSDVTATLKPPVPTTAKPLFEKRGRRVRLQKRSVSSSPQPPLTRLKVPLPPTTNTLHADERADLIRRNRKLVQLLGQTPGAEKETEVEEPRLFRMLPQPAFSALLGSAKQKHNHRHAMSVSVAVKSLKGEQSPTWNVLDCPPSPSGRRHSTPYTPRGFAFYLDGSLDSRNHDHHGPQHHWNLSGCPTSFIDLSDEELPHDSSEVISIETPSTANGCRNHSSSASSLVESFSPEEQAEAERRRKRDKLAKLHRFLGSRVPTDLVVGNIAGPSLPPASMPEDARDMWLYRRMSSASALSFERVKEELGEEEKAVNVKRAQKMEKLFGMPPPQTLYHTRHAPATVARSQPTSPVSSMMAPHYISVDDPELPRRNPNQSAYTKGKKTHRPRTSESTTFLLPTKSPNSPSSPESSQSGFLDVLTQSSVYMHYQHSIASLTDIIDRDDRESLAELHRFLHGDVVESPTDDQPLLASHRLSTSTYSHKSDRRRSLPTRTSMASISNDMIPPHRPEASDFQIRRRRAAKLTSFFGVDYRELIQDILESIEKGVEEERKRGTLRPEEVESLLHKLHDLRTRRDGFL